MSFGNEPPNITLNNKEKSTNEFGKQILPPILRKKNRKLIEEIRTFIDDEKEKTKCNKDEYDEKRFSIYSSALDKVIENTTSYKDLLADIKQEYDGCINTITQGKREANFLTRKVKALSSLPTTIAGYSRRKSELQEKLEILNEANKELEEKYNKIKHDSVKHCKGNVDENPTETLLISEEIRPIPGLTVEQWTDAKTLKQSLIKLDLTLDELTRQQKTNYVPKSVKEKSDAILNQRFEKKEKLSLEVRKLHLENSKLKMAHDAVASYRKKKAENPWFKLSLGQYIISRLATQQMMDKSNSSSSIDIEFQIPEDLETEKEAELMLEYIEKFNELFNEGEYDNAAIHAANSPRGILRTMETLLRWALRENRPDLVKHWTTTGSITSSNEIAHSVVAYSNQVPEYKSICLVVAQKMFIEVGNHLDACITLYRLQQFKALIEYTKETAEFTKNDYLELINNCPDGGLVMSLCLPQPEQTGFRDGNLTAKVLPLRFDHTIYAMIKSSRAEKKEIARFLTGLYLGDWTSHATGEKLASKQALHVIVYDETDIDNKSSTWPEIIKYCEANDLLDVAMEIQAAITVKQALINSLIAIGQAGKEDFDYYT